jgi:hypothetical protein
MRSAFDRLASSTMASAARPELAANVLLGGGAQLGDTHRSERGDLGERLDDMDHLDGRAFGERQRADELRGVFGVWREVSRDKDAHAAPPNGLGPASGFGVVWA